MVYLLTFRKSKLTVKLFVSFTFDFQHHVSHFLFYFASNWSLENTMKIFPINIILPVLRFEFNSFGSLGNLEKRNVIITFSVN